MRQSPRLLLRVESLEARVVPASFLIDPFRYDVEHILVQWQDGQARGTPWTRDAQDLGNGLFRVSLQPGVTVRQAVDGVQATRGVVFAQPDYSVTISRTPNDPSLNLLWGMENTGQSGGSPGADIRAPEAWNIGNGTRRTIVAVIDSGVDYNHPDLRDNMWRNTREVAGNGRDDDGNGFADDIFGYDFHNNRPDPMDDNGHGTHVAGIIGARGNNGIGVTGVLWNTQIMALKFLDRNGNGFLSNAVRAMNYAVRNGANVINASFGGGGNDAAMATAISNARARGVIVVAAAGNSASNNDTTPIYPANYASNNVVSVAATDRTDSLASFSNFGRNTVDIAAPGRSIYSTLPGGKYGYYNGTSMAAPFVAGAMALVWDANPTWTYRQVIDAVLNTADKTAGTFGKVVHGRLNLAAAMAYSPAAPPARDVQGAHVTNVEFSGTGSSMNQARITFSEAMVPSTFTGVDIVFTGPAGNRIAVSRITPVAGSGNTQFDVVFPAQTRVGNYTMKIGPSIRDLAGNLMDQNRNGKNGEAGDAFTARHQLSAVPTFSATDVGRAIPDRGTLTSVLPITQNLTITDIDVRVNITHTRTADLRVTLVAPDGTRVVLFERRGGNSANLTDTVFDDDSPNSIWRGTGPFQGTFKPDFVLRTMHGKNARGNWQLVVEDTAGNNVGRLNSWSLILNQPRAAARAASIAVEPPATVSASSAVATPASVGMGLLSAPPLDRQGRIAIGTAAYAIPVAPVVVFTGV